MIQEQAIAIANLVNKMLDTTNHAVDRIPPESLMWCVSLYEGYGTDKPREVLRITAAEFVTPEITQLTMLHEDLVNKRDINTRIAETCTSHSAIQYHNGVAQGYREAAKMVELALEEMKHGSR